MTGLRVDKNITHWSQYSCAGPPVSDYHESMVAASQAFTEYHVIPKLDIYRSLYNSISLGFKYHRPGLYYYLTNICICLTGSFSRLQLTEVIVTHFVQSTFIKGTLILRYVVDTEYSRFRLPGTHLYHLIMETGHHNQ